MDEHISTSTLLLFVDGELARAASHRVERHLSTCWRCRSELEWLQQTIRLIVAAQDRWLLSETPPRAWANLSPRLDAVEEAAKGRSRMARMVAFVLPTLGLSRRAAAGAFTCLMFAIVLGWWLRPARLSAQQILERAELASSGPAPRTVVHQRLRVSEQVPAPWRQHAAEMEVWSGQAGTRLKATDEKVLASLEALCAANGLAVKSLLAPTQFRSWQQDRHASLAARAEGDRFVLSASAERQRRHTDAAAGSILRTEITVRKKDWHATLVRLELADRVFEAAELSYQELPLTAVPASVFQEREPAVGTVARVMPERTSHRVPVPPSVDPDALELRVRSILRAWGADLGEPVEVIHRPGSPVVIQALGATPERLRQVAALVREIPGLVLDTTGQAGPGDPTAALQSEVFPTIVPRTREDELRLRQYFGSREAQERYTAELLTATDKVLARAYALRSLAERWQPGEESALSPVSLRQLRRLVRDHSEGLGQSAAELRALAGSLILGLGGAVEEQPSASAPNWQRAAADALSAARRTDALLRSLLTYTNDHYSLDDTLRGLSASLGSLRVAGQNLSTHTERNLF